MVRKIPWRRKWQPTPVLLPGKFHRWRSLVGYSPWGHKESDTTKSLHFHFSLSLSLMAFSQFLLTWSIHVPPVYCALWVVSLSFHQQLISSKTHNQAMTEGTRIAASTETLSRKPFFFRLSKTHALQPDACHPEPKPSTSLPSRTFKFLNLPFT